MKDKKDKQKPKGKEKDQATTRSNPDGDRPKTPPTRH